MPQKKTFPRKVIGIVSTMGGIALMLSAGSAPDLEAAAIWFYGGFVLFAFGVVFSAIDIVLSKTPKDTAEHNTDKE